MIDYKKLKKLREDTGVSFSLCKKALEETKNDITRSKKLLEDWGSEQITKKIGRSTSEGAIFTYVHHNKKIASMIELLCETDFVANNPAFSKLGQEISMQLASMKTDKVEKLLDQEYIRDPSKKVKDLMQEAIMKFGENIKINRIIRWCL